MSSDHVAYNRVIWDRQADEYQASHDGVLHDLAWGVWRIPEDEVNALPALEGRRVLELGCGAAQFGVQLALRGADVTGIDASAGQLRHAVEVVGGAGVTLPLVLADAERLPFADASFDLVFADWGAPTFTDPYLTVPEVARVLRDGGWFVFSNAHPIWWMAYDDEEDRLTERLVKGYFGMHRWELAGETTDFNLPIGEWIALFHDHGLVLGDLLELQPPEDATSTYEHGKYLEWARRWPMEILWRVRKS